MDTATRVQILDEVVNIQHSVNFLGEAMDLTIQPTAKSK